MRLGKALATGFAEEAGREPATVEQTAPTARTTDTPLDGGTPPTTEAGRPVRPARTAAGAPAGR